MRINYKDLFKVGDLVLVHDQYITKPSEAGVLRIEKFDSTIMERETIASLMDHKGKHISGRYLLKLVNLKDATPEMWARVPKDMGLDAFGMDLTDSMLRPLPDDFHVPPKIW